MLKLSKKIKPCCDAKILLEKITHANLIKLMYQNAHRLCPSLAIHVKDFVFYFLQKKSIKAIKENDWDININHSLTNDGFFPKINYINKKENIRSELYYSFTENLLHSKALAPLLHNLPPDIKYWMTKIYAAKLIDDNEVLEILPNNDIDHTIGTALYMCLLGRVPESIHVINHPIKQLATLMQKSPEYLNFNGKNLQEWFKS